MSNSHVPDRMNGLLLTIFAVSIVLLSMARIAVALPNTHSRNDFAHYYLSSRLLIEGRNPYLVPLKPLCQEYGFEFDPRIPSATNPPLLLWLFVPFAYLPPKIAAMLWALTQLCSLAVLLTLTCAMMGDKLAKQHRLWYVFIVAGSGPAYDHFYFSQVQLLLAAIALFAFWLHERGKYLSAVLCIAVIGMAKLFPLVLLPWFLWTIRGNWRYKAACWAAATAVLAGIPLLTDVTLWYDFALHGLPLVSENVAKRSGYSTPSLVINLGYAAYELQPPAEAVTVIRFLSRLVGLGCVAAGYAICFWGTADRRSQFCLLSTIMLVGSITTWTHYLVFLIFPVAVALWRILKFQPIHRVIWISMLVPLAVPRAMAGILVGIRPDSGWLIPAVLLYYLPLLSMLMLVVHFAKELLPSEVHDAGDGLNSRASVEGVEPGDA